MMLVLFLSVISGVRRGKYPLTMSLVFRVTCVALIIECRCHVDIFPDVFEAASWCHRSDFEQQ